MKDAAGGWFAVTQDLSRLHRDLRHQVRLTAETQYPVAAVLACIDSWVVNAAALS